MGQSVEDLVERFVLCRLKCDERFRAGVVYAADERKRGAVFLEHEGGSGNGCALAQPLRHFQVEFDVPIDVHQLALIA